MSFLRCFGFVCDLLLVTFVYSRDRLDKMVYQEPLECLVMAALRDTQENMVVKELKERRFDVHSGITALHAILVITG